jgi:hypothetical protein
MAEALGRTTLASAYSPRLDLHPVLGDVIAEKEAQRAGDFRDS